MSKIDKSGLEPQDAHLMIIDELLSSGWVSYTDMSILLNERGGNLVPFEGIEKIDYYKKLMHAEQGFTSGGYYVSLIKASINKMVKVWTLAHKGVNDIPDQKKRDAFIETKRISPKETEEDLLQYSLTDATKEYLRKGSRGQGIAIFRYKNPEYSIKNDLELYNKRLSHHSSARIQKQIVTGIRYDKKEAERFKITPEPDVIDRKIIALKINALRQALIEDTTKAVRMRLEEIDHLTRTKPEGWINRVAELYLNAIYDGADTLDPQDVKPVIDQFFSHLLNHFRSDFFPAESIAVILDYKKYCPWKQYPKIVRSVSPLARILRQDEFSSKDIDIIRDQCWLACSKFDEIDDDHFQEVAPLWDAIDLVMNSTTYIYNMSGVNAALTLYGIDSEIDLNTIVDCVYSQVTCLIHDFTNDYVDYFKNAETVFLSNCKSAISSLGQESAIERFIIGLTNMSTSFVTRNLAYPISDVLPESVISEGLQILNDEQKKHFTELYQTLRFEENYHSFISSASSDILSPITQEAFAQLMTQLLENLVAGNIWLERESYHHQKFLSDLKEYVCKVSTDSRSSLFPSFLLLLKYALVVVEYNPYPMDIREGCTPQLCEDRLISVIEEALQVNITDSEMQLLLLLLSMIALRHIDYYVPKEDDEEDRAYNAGVEEKAINFLPVSEFFCNKMAPGRTKDIVSKTLISVRSNGFFNGFIL